MATAIIDCFGRPSTLREFHSEAEAPQTYQCDARDEACVYMRYQADAECAIQRVRTEDGVVTRDWAFGPWEGRAGLSYVEINRDLKVDAAKVSKLFP